MLEPNSRKLLLESLQPPPDHQIDWAIGTTYSLDLIALLSAPVAFAFSDWQDREGRPIVEPLALLKAVRQYADRVCLFCQAGKIHVPRAYQPLLTNLEESIVECNAPGGGSFHAKMWFLRFRAGDGSVIYRVLCLSRNMTFDRSWDTMLSLEGPLRERANAYSRNHPLGEFVEALNNCATRPLAPQWSRRLRQTAHELRRVEFEVPEPFQEMDFWPLGLRKQPTWPFPDRMDRVLVVAPFVDNGFTADLGWHDAPSQLVSRPESLAALNEESRRAYEKLWILDDAADPEPGEAEEEAAGEAEEEAAGAASSDAGGNGEPVASAVTDSPLLGLHAKLFIADAGWNAHVWTGSANATKAALERNVEFLVELRGRKNRCGIDAILGRREEAEKKQANSLGSLLQPYIHRGDNEAQSPEERAFELQVDQLAKQMAAAAPVAQCDADEDPEQFRITIRATKRRNINLPDGYRLEARPISLPDHHLRPVSVGSPEWVSFSGISLIGLTSFVAFHVASGGTRFTRRFVLNIPLQNVPENRGEHILRHLLSDRDRVLRFLLLLLLDHNASDFGRIFGSPGESEGNTSAIHGFFQATLFESLMRALDHDPERLEHVAQVIDDLRKSPDGADLLPQDLSAVWDPIWQVRQRQLEATAKKQHGQ